MKSDRKRTILFIIILLVLSMGIGYAFLTTTLTIDGVSDIDSASWDVHFENIDPVIAHESGENETFDATLSDDGQTITYNIHLDDGDEVELNFDIVNSGSLEAVMDDLKFLINGEDVETHTPDYLHLCLATGYEGGELHPGQVLMAGETISARIHMIYSVSQDVLPLAEQSISISLTMNYTQAKKSDYYYSTYTGWALTSPKNNFHLIYNDYHDAINAFGAPFFTRFKFDNNDTLSEVYMGFVYNDNVYYFRGAGSTYNSGTGTYNDDSPFFNDNLALANELSGGCSQSSNDYLCSIGDYQLTLRKDGYIKISDNADYYCFIRSYGYSECW